MTLPPSRTARARGAAAPHHPVSGSAHRDGPAGLVRRLWPSLVVGLMATTALPACAPLLLGGAMVGTALSVSDRRTTGAQLEDQAIELKSLSRIRDTLGERGHVNVTSYNRTALLTGEVPSEADRANVERAISAIDNVRGTVNELTISGRASMTSRANDSLITSRAKARMVEKNDIQANAIKVVTERGVVYLMGIVTEIEAARAVEVTRGVDGVTKVVKVFEVISDAELAKLQPSRR